jgi:hypothetical protein
MRTIWSTGAASGSKSIFRYGVKASICWKSGVGMTGDSIEASYSQSSSLRSAAS